MQGILLSVLLFSRKANHTANLFLAAGTLALSADVFHSAYLIFGYYKDFIHFAGITWGFPFLYGPVFYLYAKLISSEEDSLKPRYFLHFIPFLLVIIYGFIFVYLRSSEFKFALIRGEVVDELPGIGFISYMKPLHGIIYVFLTIGVVRDYNNKIRNSFSSIEKINLNWLKHLTIGLSVVWGVVIITYILNAFAAKQVNMDHLIYIAASVLIYSIGYFSLRQPQIFGAGKEKIITETVTKFKAGEGTSYQRSGLTDTEAENQLNNLNRLMETEKPYLNSEVTLRDLASMLSVSAHNLSEILNTRLNQNFYDFINRYRVEEVKKRLGEHDADRYNLIAIAFDSGFNSKSAFNTIFKKHTGITPSQYRKQVSGTMGGKKETLSS